MKKILTVSTLAAVTVLFGVACGRNSQVAPVDGLHAQAAGAEIGGAAESDVIGYEPESAGLAYATSGMNPCISVSPNPPVDSDHDGTPDDVTFTATDCEKALPNGDLARFDGTMQVQDPTADVADFNVVRTDNTELKVKDPAGTLRLDQKSAGVIDGSEPTAGTFERKVNKSDDTIFQGPGDTVAHHAVVSRNWTVDYTPASAWNPGQPMVAGSVSISGTFSGTIDGQSIDGDVTTLSPLSVDPACPTHVVGGELKREMNKGTHTRTIDVQWTGCGQKTVTFSQT